MNSCLLLGLAQAKVNHSPQPRCDSTRVNVPRF